jgi:hypothetical protein
MADHVKPHHVKLLGFVAAKSAEALAARLAAVPGPPVSLFCAGGLAALAQADKAGGRALLPQGRRAILNALASVQRRLEVACLHGPFLPADPAEAGCRAAEVATLLAGSADSIAAALAGPGTCHQWDVVLHWQAEPIVEARRAEIKAAASGGGRAGLAEAVAAALGRERALREEALVQAVARVALAVQPARSGTTETAVTALVHAGEESVLEAALRGLAPQVSDGASADLRGPLPPISFAAVRITRAAPGEVEAAWNRLALPDWVDAAVLRRHWHACAARLHPDHGAKDDGPITEAGAAFRLLRGLLPAETPQKPWSLAALQRRGNMRLTVPATALETFP